jgi:exodeoxyribonuclease VII small subunit
MSETEKTLSFEEKLQQVQELTARIESGALPLEDSVEEYERGMKILGELTAELGGMSRRLTVLQNGKETEVSDENT